MFQNININTVKLHSANTENPNTLKYLFPVNFLPFPRHQIANATVIEKAIANNTANKVIN